MIEFSDLLFSLIASRIKERRKKRKISAFKFADIIQMDKSDWNKIENCKINKKKNPYLLSKKQIYRTADALNISPEELIFGNSEEKEQLVKLILLAVLLNVDKLEPDNIKANPFMQESLFKWLEYEQKINPLFENKKALKLNEEEYTRYIYDKYGYWFDKNNHSLYELLNVKYDTSIERSSNLLLKLLCSDYAFSSSFINRLINESGHAIRLINKVDSTTMQEKTADSINDYVLNKGNYSNLILDYYSIDYKLFITAFDSFWGKYKSYYISFFQNNLFSLVINPPFKLITSWGGEEDICDKKEEKNDDNEKEEKNDEKKLVYDINKALEIYKISEIKLTSLKIFNNQLLIDLIISKEFVELSEQLLFNSEYKESESMFANLGTRMKFLRAYSSSKLIDGTLTPEDTKCLASIINATEQVLAERFSNNKMQPI